MSFKHWLRVAVLSAAAGIGHTAMSEEPAEQAIQNRVAGFREIGAAYKYIRDELKSARPHLPRIEESAQSIDVRGADMLHWFPPGSEPVATPETSWLDAVLAWLSFEDAAAVEPEVASHARRTIWTEPREFAARYRTFQTEARQMSAIAKGGQLAAISNQFKKLGKTCQDCHDRYREASD